MKSERYIVHPYLRETSPHPLENPEPHPMLVESFAGIVSPFAVEHNCRHGCECGEYFVWLTDENRVILTLLLPSVVYLKRGRSPD